MSRSVDDRIVRLQFDNKEFEKHAQTSMSTLDKLKKSLEFKNVAKGFQNVNNGIQSITFSPIQNGIDAVTSHFSRMEMTWSMVLANMINKAIDAGTKMVNALTIDPVKTGFQEYETQMNAIQTIWANTKDKGTSMEDITKALDELNRYADQTIYNFTQMTNNIGRFTAAGVELDTAVTAIKGISNLAAISGASAEDASRAMYQLSQAMASGTIKLMDWNSVVNANMGGEGFQNVLKETAREHGIAVDAIIKKSGSFRESLSKNWLTTEVLIDALEKYTDTTTELGRTATDAATKVKTFTQLWDTLKESVQSGWSESWRLIIGDFEEARNIFTKLSDALQGFLSPFAEARNAVLRTWAGVSDSSEKTSEHIDDVSKSINELDEVAMRVIRGDYKNGIDIRFPLLEADGYDAKAVQNRVNEIVYGVKKASDDATKAVTEPVIDPLTGLTGREMVIKGLSAQLERLRSALLFVKSAFQSVFPPMTGERLIELSRKFMEFSQKPIIATESILGLRKTLQGIFSVFSIGIKSVKFIIKVFTKLLGIIDPLNSGIFDFTGSIGEFIYNLDKGVLTTEFFTDAVDKVVDTIIKLPAKIRDLVTSLGDFIGIDFEKIFGKVSSAGSKAFDGVVEAAASLKKDPIKSIEDFTDRAIEKFKPLEWIKTFYTSLFNTVKLIGSKIWNGIKWIAGGFVDLFRNLENPFKNFSLEDGLDLTKIFTTGTIGAAFIAITKFFLNFEKNIEKINIGGKFGQIISSIAAVLDGVTGIFVAFQNSLKANILLKIAGAIGILALSLIAISALDDEPLYNAMTAIAELFAGIILSLKALNGVEMVSVGGTLSGLALAVASLVGAVVVLGFLPQDKISDGIASVLLLVATLTGAISFMGKRVDVIVGAAGAMLSMAVAINMLLIPVTALGLLPWDVVSKGLFAVTLLIAALTGSLAVLTMVVGKTEVVELPAIAGILVAMSTAISILITSMLPLALLDTEKMLASFLMLLGIIAALTAGVVAFAAIGKAGTVSVLTVSLGLTSLVASLTLLLPAIAALTLIDSKKLATVVGLISVLVIAISVGLLIVSKASKGLAILTGTLAALTLASTLFISSIVAFLAGITAFANSDLTGLGDRLGEACDAIVKNGPKLRKAFATILKTSFGAFGDARDELIEEITDTIFALLDAVATNVVGITDRLFDIISDVLTTVFENIQENADDLVLGFVDTVIALINAVAKALDERSEDIVEAIGNLGASLVKVVSEAAEKILEKAEEIGKNILSGIKTGLDDATGNAKIGTKLDTLLEDSGIKGFFQIGIDFGKDFLGGFSQGMDEGINNLPNAISKLVTSWWNWVIEDSPGSKIAGAILGEIYLTIEEGVEDFSFEDFFKTLKDHLLSPTKLLDIYAGFWDFGWDLVGRIVQGISPGLYRVGDKLKEIGNLTEWIDELKDKMKQVGKDLIEGLVNGVKEGFENWKVGMEEIADKVVGLFDKKWKINSPSKVMIERGKSLDEGIAVGLQKGTSYIDKSINTMSDDMYSSLSKTMGDLNDAIYTDIDYEPQIKPVLNLDDVTRNANYLNGMFTNQEIALRQLGASMSTRVSFDEIQNGRYSDQNVLTELRNLRSDITNLNSAMSHMQVVMDSGALVGSIAAPMDSALGRRHIYSRRGV